MSVQEVKKRRKSAPKKGENGYQETIDRELFCRLVMLEGVGPKEAYKKAGYQQEGARDYSATLAQQYLKQSKTREMMQALKDNALEHGQGLTMKRFNDFLENEYFDLSPKDKATFLTKRMDQMGLTAPKKVEIENNQKVEFTVEGLVESLLGIGNLNPDVQQIINGATTRDVTETAAVIDVTPTTGTDS